MPIVAGVYFYNTNLASTATCEGDSNRQCICGMDPPSPPPSPSPPPPSPPPPIQPYAASTTQDCATLMTELECKTHADNNAGMFSAGDITNIPPGCSFFPASVNKLTSYNRLTSTGVTCASAKATLNSDCLCPHFPPSPPSPPPTPPPPAPPPPVTPTSFRFGADCTNHLTRLECEIKATHVGKTLSVVNTNGMPPGCSYSNLGTTYEYNTYLTSSGTCRGSSIRGCVCAS